MPKEGTYNADYSAFGAAKPTAIGKERVLITFDENGLWLSKGFAEHMTWHCFGLIDILSGMEQFHGYRNVSTTLIQPGLKFRLGSLRF